MFQFESMVLRKKGSGGLQKQPTGDLTGCPAVPRRSSFRVAFWTTFGEYFGPPSGGILDHPLERGRAQDDQKKGVFCRKTLKIRFFGPQIGPVFRAKKRGIEKGPVFQFPGGGARGVGQWLGIPGAATLTPAMPSAEFARVKGGSSPRRATSPPKWKTAEGVSQSGA